MSVAIDDGNYYMGFGSFTGGLEHSSILRFGDAAWSEFQDGTDTWGTSEGGLALAIGEIGGSVVVVVHAVDTFYKIRLSDGNLVSTYELPEEEWDREVAIDSSGRVWLGGGGGITVYDLGGAEALVIGERQGLDAGRFALREDGGSVHVYYGGFRSPAVIGHTVVDF
jgi:hypothetical protein